GDLVRVAGQVHACGRAGHDVIAVTGDVDRVTGPGQGDVVAVAFQVDGGVVAGHCQRGAVLGGGDRAAGGRAPPRGEACLRRGAGVERDGGRDVGDGEHHGGRAAGAAAVEPGRPGRQRE